MASALMRVALLLLVCAFPVGTLAHDPKAYEANSLAEAKNKLGGMCCDGKDYEIPLDW